MLVVYVLNSRKDGKWYTGITNNLQRRLREHNQGGSFSTKPRGPFTLIYAEAYRNRTDAQEREKFLKSGWGRAYLKKVLKNFLQESKI